MKRLHPIFDSFSAKAGEVITVTVRARQTVFMATHSPLSSGGTWAQLTAPAPANPVDVRQFTMPAADESFAIMYQFSPSGALPQSYEITFEGENGSKDGPRPVARPGAAPTIALDYTFAVETSPATKKAAGSTVKTAVKKAAKTTVKRASKRK